MVIVSNIRIAIEQLSANKLRSVLTVVGIVIAVMSTITVVSIVQGFTGYVADFLQGLGTNAMWVWPERPPGDAGRALGRIEMNVKDMNAVDYSCDAVRVVSPMLMRPGAKLSYGGTEINAPVEGVAASYHAIRNFPVDAGRPFSIIDIEQAHHVCIVGRDVLRKLSVGDDVIDDMLLVDGRRFRVIGVLESKGSFLGESQDNVVWIPYTMAIKMYPGFRRNVVFSAQATEELAVPEARAQIVNLLRRRHRLEAHQPNDFNVRTQDEILSAFNNMSMIATVVLSGIVGISLLVGGIGIMNVMLVSVTERTREIGLRKAVGARRRDIMAQFLMEAMTLSLLGGGLGILFGYGLSSLASMHPKMVDIAVPAWAVMLGFGISAGTGVVFGLLPAVKAALLNPIDALRHE